MVDSMIRIFDKESQDFSTLGEGVLSQPSSCYVIEELNNMYEAELKYSIGAVNFNLLDVGKILVMRPNPFDDPQAFRIYSISKPINGTVTVKAEHISYDLHGYVMQAIGGSLSECLAILNDPSKILPVNTCPFTFTSNVVSQTILGKSNPTSVRAFLGNTKENSIRAFYDGDFKFDNYSVSFLSHRGMNRGVVISYGKNMTELNYSENISEIYTDVYPFWISDAPDVDGSQSSRLQEFLTKYPVWYQTFIGEYPTYQIMTPQFLDLPEKLISLNVPATVVKRVFLMDLSSEFEDLNEDEAPTEAQLRAKANEKIAELDLTSPEISLDVSFVQLSQSSEYASTSSLDEIQLGDTVKVTHESLGVEANLRCTKTEYDVVLGRYKKITLGQILGTASNLLAQHNTALSSTSTKSYVDKLATKGGDQAVNNADARLTVLETFKTNANSRLIVLETFETDANGRLTVLETFETNANRRLTALETFENNTDTLLATLITTLRTFTDTTNSRLTALETFETDTNNRFTTLITSLERFETSVHLRLNDLETFENDVKDYIEAIGSSGNWTYEKYHSGSCKCWYSNPRINLVGTTATAILNGFMTTINDTLPSSLFKSGTTPCPFVSAEIVGSTMSIANVKMTSNSSLTVSVYGDIESNAININSLHVEGRWK